MSARLRASVARALRPTLVVALVAAEPVLHALGVPHPEGLSAYAAQVLHTR